MRSVEEFEANIDRSNDQPIVASVIEAYFDKTVAPFVTRSILGRLSIMSCYSILIGVSIHGLLQMKSYFSRDLIITENYPNYEFMQVEKMLFPQFSKGYFPVTVIDFGELDYRSEEAQLLQYKYVEKLSRCETCELRWNMPGTLESSFFELRKWIDLEKCPHVSLGIDPFKKTVDPTNFEKCMELWR